MSYLGYYGDGARGKAIGYTPYSRRPGGPPAAAGGPRPSRRCARSPAPPRERYDTVVVGSGAAGGDPRLPLAEAGRRVLVVERGPHVDPGEFGEDEVGQYLRLYNEGALQLATDFRLQVLQGMCVGGGTTINNAVCIDAAGRGAGAVGGARHRPGRRCARGSSHVRDWLGVRRDRREGDEQGRPALRRRASSGSTCPARSS